MRRIRRVLRRILAKNRRPTYVTAEEALRNVTFEPAGIRVRMYHHGTLTEGVDWYYPNWFTWRWLTKFPEDFGTRETHESHHHEVAGSEEMGPRPFTANMVHPN